MPLPEKELEQIPENHQIRPYWIAEIKADFVTGFYCSSKAIKSCPAGSAFIIDNAITKIRDSHVDLRRLFRIPLDNLIEPICSVPLLVQNQANKRLILQYRKNNNRPTYQFPVPLTPAPGDLLKSIGLIIDDHDGRCTVVVPCPKSSGNAVSGRINDRLWHFDAHYPQEISKSDYWPGDLLGLADWELIHRLRQEHKKWLPKPKTEKKQKPQVKLRKAPYPCGQILEDWSGQRFVFVCAANKHDYGYILDDFMPDKLRCLSSGLIVTPLLLPSDQLDEDLEALIENHHDPITTEILRHVQNKRKSSNCKNTDTLTDFAL